jgi:hypothetical protein
MSTHTRCEGKDRFKCPCWEQGAREEAAFHTLRPATRELTEYIRAVGDSDPALTPEEMAGRACDVFAPNHHAAPLNVERLAAAIRANWYEIRPYGGAWVRPADAAEAILASLEKLK